MEHQLADSSSDAESSGITGGDEEEDGDEDGGAYIGTPSPHQAFPGLLLFVGSPSTQSVPQSVCFHIASHTLLWVLIHSPSWCF